MAMDLYQTRSTFLKQTLFNLHNGAAALSPVELGGTPAYLPRKALVVGHSGALEWQFHHRNPTHTPVDFVFVNQPQGLSARPDAELAEYDFQVVQLPLRSVFPDHAIWGGSARTDAEMEAIFQRSVATLKALFSQYLQYNTQANLPSFVVNFMVPAVNPLGKLASYHDLRNPQYFVARLNQELEFLVKERGNAHVLDVDSLTSFYGKKLFQDDLLHPFSYGGCWPGNLKDESRIEAAPPLHEHYVVAGELFRSALWMEIISAFRIANPVQPVKLIVVDLDDTLWQGALETLESVDAGMVEGWPAGLLEALSYFRDRGGLLAILSRNHRHLVEQAWARLYGNRFPLTHFVSVQCGFAAKSDMMLEILRETGVAPNSVLLIDDHPVQRAEIKAAFPDIRVLHGYHYYWRKILLLAPETQGAWLSRETDGRAEPVNSPVSLQEDLVSSLPREPFLQGLKIVVEMRQLEGREDPAFERSFELLNKTSQFNSTGRRWSREEFTAFAAEHRAVCVSVEDRYAAYGVAGLVLMKHNCIEQIVMSRRVLGVDIEQGVMDTLLRHGVEHWSMSSVTAHFKDNGVNGMCRDFLAACGFGSDPWGDGWLRLNTQGRPALTHCGTFNARLPETPPVKRSGLKPLASVPEAAQAVTP
jgi:FkbH-like protein